jgi:hypothetical protein
LRLLRCDAVKDVSNFDNEKAPGAIKKQTKNLTRARVPVLAWQMKKYVTFALVSEPRYAWGQNLITRVLNLQVISSGGIGLKSTGWRSRSISPVISPALHLLRVVNLAMVCARAHLAHAVAQR